MSTQSFNATLLDLLPDTIIELYEIDLGEQDGVFRFHPGIIANSNLIFDENVYHSLPVDALGFEKRGDGRLPRPKLTIANLDGILSDLIKQRGDLVGFLFNRKRTFLKYIDSVNFPNNFNPFAVPDPDARFKDDVFIINKKTQENKFYVEFELISPLEFENAKIPARQIIAGYCPWKYRGSGCRYGQIIDSSWKPAITVGGNQKTWSNVFLNANLGLPLADDENKLFFEPDGYNIQSIQWRGDYQNDVSNYVRGDVVRIKPRMHVLSKLNILDTTEDLSNQPDYFYVCIKNTPSAGLDPRYEKEYWVADQCSRNLDGCRIRFKNYGAYSKGLPFGGFPSTESYNF